MASQEWKSLGDLLRGAREEHRTLLEENAVQTPEGLTAELEPHLTALAVPWQRGETTDGERFLEAHSDFGLLTVSQSEGAWFVLWQSNIELDGSSESDRFCRVLLCAHTFEVGGARYHILQGTEEPRVLAAATIGPSAVTCEAVRLAVLGVLACAARICEPIYPSTPAVPAECRLPLPRTKARESDTDGEATLSLTGLGRIARWTQAVTAGRTLGEALDVVSRGVLPNDVAEAVSSFREVSLDAITQTARSEAFRTAFEDLLARAGSDRHARVLCARLALRPQTLEEVATALRVTRERVRELQIAAEKDIGAASEEAEFEEIRWRAQEVRRQFGTAIPYNSAHVQELLARLTDGLPDERREPCTSILLWLAGPYRYDRKTDWIHTGPVSRAGPPATEAFLRSAADLEGRLDREALDSMLVADGMVQVARTAWFDEEPHIRNIAGSLFHWHGTIVDKSANILLALGEPATADELNDQIGEGHNVRGLRGRVLSDDRFIRTDRVRIGLRVWGLEEYTGIVDEIGEEIDARGGEAPLDEVISTVAQRFGLRVALGRELFKRSEICCRRDPHTPPETRRAISPASGDCR